MTKRLDFIRVGHLWGALVEIHWVLPLMGTLLLFVEYCAAWKVGCFILGMTLLVIIHELGHATMAQFLNVPLFRIEIKALSGYCQIDYPRQISHSALVWSAGLLAQLVVLLLTWLYVTLEGWPASGWGSALAQCFTRFNIYLMVFNLIPSRHKDGVPNDGKVLWDLYRHVYHKHPLPSVVILNQEKSPIFSPDQHLLDLPQFRNSDFVQGVEILNNDSTTMVFVMDLLLRHLGLTEEEASERMFEIHNQGGVLIPVHSPAASRAAVAAMIADIQAAGSSLVCRYADIHEEKPAPYVGSSLS